MSKIRLILRWLLIPLWLAIFIVYLPIWYIQMSWYYFNFGDYWDSYLVLWDRVMLSLKLKRNIDMETQTIQIRGDNDAIAYINFVDRI